MSSNAENSLPGLIDDIDANVESGPVSLGQILDSISSRGFGPLLLVPALISVSPIGGIPGMSIFTGAILLILAGQMLFGAHHPWVPSRLEEISIPQDKFASMIDTARPWFAWADGFIGERLTAVVSESMLRVVAVAIILLAISYFPLALIPMGVFLPGLANTLFAIGITARDGLLVLFGLICSLSALAFGIYTLIS